MLTNQYWRTQPNSPVRIDTSNPIAEGLVAAIPLNGSIYDALGGQRGNMLASGSWQPLRNGTSLRSTGTSAGAGSIAYANLGGQFPSFQIHLGFWLKVDAYDNTDRLAFEYTPNGSAFAGFWVNPCDSTGNFTWQFVPRGGFTASNYKLASRPSAGVWHRYDIQWDWSVTNPKVKRAWVDGVSQTVSVLSLEDTTHSGNQFDVGASLYFMERDGGTVTAGGNGSPALFLAGNLRDLCIWRRLLQETEIRALYQEPWQMYSRAQVSSFLVQTPSGAAVNYSDSLGFTATNSFTPSVKATTKDTLTYGVTDGFTTQNISLQVGSVTFAATNGFTVAAQEVFQPTVTFAESNSLTPSVNTTLQNYADGLTFGVTNGASFVDANFANSLLTFTAVPQLVIPASVSNGVTTGATFVGAINGANISFSVTNGATFSDKWSFKDNPQYVVSNVFSPSPSLVRSHSVSFSETNAFALAVDNQNPVGFSWVNAFGIGLAYSAAPTVTAAPIWSASHTAHGRWSRATTSSGHWTHS